MLFALVLLVITAVLAPVPGGISDPVPFGIGVTLAILGVGLARVVPWSRLPPQAAILVPLVDFLAIGLCRYGAVQDLGAITLLCFLPAIWLVTRFERWGMHLGAVLTLFTSGIPLILLQWGQPVFLSVVRALMVALAVWLVALLLADRLRREKSFRSELSERGRERDRLLQETEHHQHLLTEILDSLDAGIVLVGRDGRAQVTNAAARRHQELASHPENGAHPTGRISEDRAIPGAVIDDQESVAEAERRLSIRYPGTVTRIPRRLRRVYRASNGESFRNHLIGIGPEEAETTLAVSAGALVDAGGNRTASVVVYQDVTAVVQAQKLQSQFVATVSHELRTPLTSIIGYLDLASERDDPEATGMLLDVALRNAEQLLVIVQDLLRQQSADGGALRLQPEPAHLNDVAHHCLLSVRNRAENQGITLVDRVAETPVLSMDTARITQVLDNLLSNALKFTEPGGTVTVTTEIRPGTVDVAVSDTGAGMTDEEQANVFRRYYRTPGATRRRIPGYGLGLAISQEIVEAHGGQLTLRSLPGEGSTFQVSLPRTHLSVGPTASIAPSEDTVPCPCPPS
jgi:signal transduction histidine kinase